MGDRSVRLRRDTSVTAPQPGKNSPLIACQLIPEVHGDMRVYIPYRGDDTIVRTSVQPNPTVSPTTSHDAPSIKTKKG